jgi:hypothetical protein
MSIANETAGDVAILIASESESSSETHVHDACEISSDTATMRPIHPDDDVSTEDEKVVVLKTCTELLEKLEAVRLSVLHLQYSLHASEVCAVSTESVDRSRTLWNWDNMNIVSMPPSGNTVSMEPNGNTVTTHELGADMMERVDMSRVMWSFDNMNPLTPMVTEQSVEELEEGERLSQDAISAGINVFDGCPTDDFDDRTSRLQIERVPTDAIDTSDATSHTDDAAESDL